MRAELAAAKPGPRCPAALHVLREVVLDEPAGSKVITPGADGGKLVAIESQRFLSFVSAGCEIAFAFVDLPKALSAEEAADVRKRVDGVARADAKLSEADAARGAGAFAEALALTTAACGMRRAALGEQHPHVALCEVRQSRNAVSAGKYAEALVLAEKARATLIAAAGAGNAEALAARNAEAQALYYLDRMEDMHRIASEVWGARKQLFGPSSRESLETQNTVAVALRNLGRTREAIGLYEDLATKRAQLDGPTAPETLRAKGNLAAAYLVLGEVTRASILYVDVLASNVARLGSAHPTTLITLREAVQAQWDTGSQGAALQRLEEKLSDYVSQLGAPHPETLRVQSLLATFYEAQGRREEAEQLYRRVFDGRRAVLGPTHTLTLESARNIVAIMLLEDRPTEALEFADGVLAQLPAVEHASEDRRRRDLLQVRAVALMETGRPAVARGVFESTLSSSFRRNPEVERASPEDLEALQWAARARFLEGGHDEGISGLEAVQQVREKRLGADHPSSLSTLASLADLYVQAGREAQALDALARLVERTESRIQGGLGLDRANRGEISLRAISRFDEASYRTLAILLARKDAQRALAIAELSKGRALTQEIGQRYSTSRDVRARDLAIRLAKAEESLATSDPQSPSYLQAAAERARAEAELRDSRRGPARTETLNPATLASALPPRTAFISYIVDRDRVAAIVATRSRVSALDLGKLPSLAATVEVARRVAASPDAASERVWKTADGRFQWSLTAPSSGSERVKDPREVVHWLSDRLLSPVTAVLDPATTWVVSPDGALAFLPFEILRWRGREAIQSKAISYAVSLELHLRTPARVDAGAPTFLGVGISEHAGRRKLPELPGAVAEARAVAALFPAASRTLLLGEEADEGRLSEMDASGALVKFRYLHFATHGVIEPRAPQLSAIYLAPSRAGSGQDGRLTAAEWTAFHLNADLAVLSACNTGLGRLNAAEGVLGLPYAFMAAGARRLVLTLWTVPDESAADFMPKFYRRLLGGKSAAEALRETKLEFARSKGPWSAPRHWAPYVLYGAS